ncbi:type II toxin-antitoxin system TacA family antitoxin [Arthrobacter rhombi]|uniref:type II toxin-antitoxin system TacA family antitoxin n=1 Tax=Arthrobacter rhombi TaxID=71253 RepID=UPI003FD3368A
MENKTQRINLRTTTRQESVIRRAADATQRSVTDFVLDAASVEAERIMADRRWFELSNEQWAEFERLLEEPLPSNSKLASLAARTSPFSE